MHVDVIMLMKCVAYLLTDILKQNYFTKVRHWKCKPQKLTAKLKIQASWFLNVATLFLNSKKNALIHFKKPAHLFLISSSTDIYIVITSNLKVVERKHDDAKVNISGGNHQQAAKQYQL